MGHRPPRADGASPQRKRAISREESMTSRLSKLKTSLFGPSKELLPQQRSLEESSSSPPTVAKKTKARPPVRYDLPADDSSEPSQYFKEHGHPWTAVRAPTPLPPFGTQEYYSVIKSSNPSPTTSNESELGSTPDDISSKEEIYMSENPDLPETSPAAAAVPARVSNVANVINVSESVVAPTVVPNVIENPLSSFVPVQVSTSATAGTSGKSSKARHSLSYLTRAKKLHDRAATSSGEEAIFIPLTKLTKTHMNQSDPGLSSTSNIVDVTPLVTLKPESQVGEYISKPSSSQLASVKQEEGSPSSSRDFSTSLTRQTAFDPGSSRENTPQK